MAVKFFNIKSGESRTAVTEPMIAAYFNSSDRHVNALVGQDMGWRLAPETLKRMQEVRNDSTKLMQIATSFQLPLDAIGDTDILYWISLEDDREEAVSRQQKEASYAEQYEAEVRALNAPPVAEVKADEKKTAPTPKAPSDVKS